MHLLLLRSPQRRHVAALAADAERAGDGERRRDGRHHVRLHPAQTRRLRHDVHQRLQRLGRADRGESGEVGRGGEVGQGRCRRRRPRGELHRSLVATQRRVRAHHRAVGVAVGRMPSRRTCEQATSSAEALLAHLRVGDLGGDAGGSPTVALHLEKRRLSSACCASFGSN